MNDKKYHIFSLVPVVLSFAGLITCLWLTYVHIRVFRDPFYESVCAVGNLVNCDSVAASRFSVLLWFPVSVWGAAYYLIFLLLSIDNTISKGERRHGIMGLWSFIGVVNTIAYTFISIKYTKSLCPGCIFVHAVNLVLAWCCLKRLFVSGDVLTEVKNDLRELFLNGWTIIQLSALTLLIVVSGPVGGFPQYWETASFRGGPQMPHGLTEENLPWIGAAQPTVTVLEFFDYECPACRRSHRKLRGLLTTRSKIVRVIRHDMSRVPCVGRDGNGIEDRCILARAGYCASNQSRFWEFNDAFLADPRPDELPDRVSYALELAKQLGMDEKIFAHCMDRPESYVYAERIHRDGLSRGIKSTPTYIVKDKLLRSKELLPWIQSF